MKPVKEMSPNELIGELERMIGDKYQGARSTGEDRRVHLGQEILRRLEELDTFRGIKRT